MNSDVVGINFSKLADEIGIEFRQLPILFSAFKKDSEHIFPLLAEAISSQNFSSISEYSHALKGIIGNMRLYDLYEMVVGMNYSARNEDLDFLYHEYFIVIKRRVEEIIDSFFSE